MASQVPPSGRPWLLRLASQTGRADPQAEAPPQPTAPQQAPRPVGLSIRQASLALGRPPLFPTATATQPSRPPPPLQPVATQPAPLRPSTVATNGSAIVTPRQSPTPTLATTMRSPTPPPPSPKLVAPEPEVPKPVLEGQVKRVVVDEQQRKKNGTAVEGIKNGGNGNSSPAASINSAAADQKEETKNSPASKNSWAIPTNAAATPANKQGAREMGGVTIAGYNIGAFMDLGTSSSSSFISHQIRRQQVRSMKSKF